LFPIAEIFLAEQNQERSERRTIVESIAAKVFESIERTEHLVSLVPADRLTWRPNLRSHLPRANDLGHTLGHLLDCLAGFCAAFHAAFPEDLADFAELRELPVNHACSVGEVTTGSKKLAEQIARGFRCCSDADLARLIPTVFAANGETLATLLLGNLEHLLNHKYQLFVYLKLAGVEVSTKDLYRFRSAPSEASG
jgi:DinB superfamily